MHRNDRFRFGLAVVLAGAVTALGCASPPTDPGGPSAGPDEPRFVEDPAAGGSRLGPTGEDSNSGSGSPQVGSAVIHGREGGEVNAGRFRVVVPPGAFTGAATVTVTVPDPSVLRCDLGIQPASANGFAVPVTLVTDVNGLVDEDDLDDLEVLWFDETRLDWQQVGPTTIDAERRELHTALEHFSLYGVAWGRSGW